MSARRNMLEDRQMRDAARSLVVADVENLKADLARRGFGARVADRIAEGASDVYEEAIDVARDHKGALAAIATALVLWFARHPILEGLFGEPPDEDEQYDGEHHDRDERYR